MLIWTLIVVNIPVYLLIGWLIFDTKDRAADTFFETIVEILKRITMSPFQRFIMDDKDEGDGLWGLFPIVVFFISCALVVYGEYWAITHWFPANP